MIRPSGTESLIRVMVEGENKNQVENIGLFSYHFFIFVFYMYYWIDSPKKLLRLQQGYIKT